MRKHHKKKESKAAPVLSFEGDGIKVCQVEKYYGTKNNITKAVDRVSFAVEKGEFVGIMGASGSGKTTLLNLMAAIDRVSAGHIYYGGVDITELDEDALSDFRKENLGFVFQDFNLLDTLTIEENIMLAMGLQGKKKTEVDARTEQVLKTLGIWEIRGKFPGQVSGGQKQRCACARALVNEPKLILADEPTGALDSRSTDELLQLFSAIHEEGQTILMVTHSVKAASSAHRVLFIKDGEVFHQIYRGNSTSSQMYEKISQSLTALTTGGER